MGEQNIPNREKGTFTSSKIHPTVIETVRDCIIYNSGSRIEMSDDALYEPYGNGTEIGLLRFLTDNEISIHDRYLMR